MKLLVNAEKVNFDGFDDPGGEESLGLGAIRTPQNQSLLKPGGLRAQREIHDCS